MRIGLSSIVLVAALVAVPPPRAQGAADLNFREFRLRHVCEGGETPGAVCCDPTECGTGVCALDSIGKASGLLTLVIDDDVSGIDGSSLAGHRVRALTVILETKGKSGVVLAQTFQQLDGSSLANLIASLEAGPADEFGFRASEDLLAQFTDRTADALPPDVTWLIYRTLDAETLREMRTRAGLAPDGPELLVVRPDKLKLDRYANTAGATNRFASVLRVKLNAFFVAPKPAQCL